MTRLKRTPLPKRYDYPIYSVLIRNDLSSLIQVSELSERPGIVPPEVQKSASTFIIGLSRRTVIYHIDIVLFAELAIV